MKRLSDHSRACIVCSHLSNVQDQKRAEILEMAVPSRSRLLYLDVRPPSHRQWSELRHTPSAQHPYELANQLQKP